MKLHKNMIKASAQHPVNIQEMADFESQDGRVNMNPIVEITVDFWCYDESDIWAAIGYFELSLN